jgi:UDP-glucose 6-dehydrogenase
MAASGEDAVSRITVIGTGYLGTAQAACLAEMGFQVLGMDADPAKVGALSRGVLPFYEPGLEPLLRSGLKSGRLSFTTSYAEAAAFGDLYFICVGTPQRAGSYRADLSQVHGCLRALGTLLDRPCRPNGCRSSLPPAPPASSPGTRSSCGRGMPSTTRCAQTGSSPE